MPDLLKNLSHTDYLCIGGGFAGLTGSVSYLLKVTEGKPFKWSEFFVHIAASMIFGLIAFEIGAYEGLPDEFSGALAGCAGWLGTRVARIIEVLACKKLGLSKDDLK